MKAARKSHVHMCEVRVAFQLSPRAGALEGRSSPTRPAGPSGAWRAHRAQSGSRGGWRVPWANRL